MKPSTPCPAIQHPTLATLSSQTNQVGHNAPGLSTLVHTLDNSKANEKFFALRHTEHICIYSKKQDLSTQNTLLREPIWSTCDQRKSLSWGISAAVTLGLILQQLFKIYSFFLSQPRHTEQITPGRRLVLFFDWVGTRLPAPFKPPLQSTMPPHAAGLWEPPLI